MRRKFLLPALAACAMLATGAPVASAANAHAASRAHVAAKSTAISFALTAIKNLQSKVGALRDMASGFTDAFKRLDSEVGFILSNVPTITGALTKLGDGLTAIQSALNNTSTGLVGLNLARPQFGAYSSTGVFQGGTGTVSGAQGPKADALGHSNGNFVIDFGNDVSKRFLVVNPFPGSASAGTPQAVDCAATGAGSSCGALQAATSDTNPNHVLVIFGSGSAAPAAGFSVAAISG